MKQRQRTQPEPSRSSSEEEVGASRMEGEKHSHLLKIFLMASVLPSKNAPLFVSFFVLCSINSVVFFTLLLRHIH